MAVAICSTPAQSGACTQDGCIAAYHFLLASRLHGLGTCWIAAMDRSDVKESLGVPKEHYIATVTPVGYPATIPETPPRRKAEEMVKFVD
jgi:nitroreductase